MTSSSRILGTLGTAEGQGVVRMEDGFDTSIDDVWSALTDRERLAVWYGTVEGEMGPAASTALISMPAAGRARDASRRSMRRGTCGS